MKEVEVDEKWIMENGKQELPAPEVQNEENLVIIGLLMRLYDVQMAILSNTNREEADRIYDAHAAGGHFNPPIYVPEPVR